jgi:hypothetical protein
VRIILPHLFQGSEQALTDLSQTFCGYSSSGFLP